jgi:voltage-gated potassium channel
MDATSEEALLKAGIMEANGIVTALASDADNVFITLTAKGLQPDIYILARASHENNEDKLSRAGASRVVSPHLIGGRRMAQVLKRPTVVDFIDIATMGSSLGLMMEEATVGNGSGLPGKNLVDSNLRKDFGVIIVAMLEAGDVIVVIGKKEDLKRMNAVM